jgi:hypothetical protein
VAGLRAFAPSRGHLSSGITQSREDAKKNSFDEVSAAAERCQQTPLNKNLAPSRLRVNHLLQNSLKPAKPRSFAASR